MYVSVSEKETRISCSGGEVERSSSASSPPWEFVSVGWRPQVEVSSGRVFMALTIDLRMLCWVEGEREPVSGSDDWWIERAIGRGIETVMFSDIISVNGWPVRE